jgi:hypothetical protein
MSVMLLSGFTPGMVKVKVALNALNGLWGPFPAMEPFAAE